MLRYLPASLISAALLVTGAAAHAESPLQPIKSWRLDYGETQCLAYRDYGDAADPVTLAFRPAPNGETYEILVAQNRPGPAFAEELEGSVDFGRGPIKAWLLHYRVKEAKLDVHQFRISAAEMEQARSARSLLVHSQGASDIGFTLQLIPELLKGLETCTGDLMRYWNMGGKVDTKIAVPPKGDIRGAFSPSDYPADAMAHRQEGTVQYLLLVDEAGRVAGCHIQRASGVPALDAMGCQVVQKRVKFSPALDAARKPLRSVVVTPPVVWRLGG